MTSNNTSIDKDRKLILALQKYAQGLMGGCKVCGGEGIICTDQNCHSWPCGRGHKAIECSVPCPTCAPIRELELPAPNHDLKYSHPVGGIHWKCACGEEGYSHYKINEHVNPKIPDLTTKLHTSDDGTVWYVRHVLEVLGLWEQFVIFNFMNSRRNKYDTSEQCQLKQADILTNSTHLRGVALVFMEKVGK